MVGFFIRLEQIVLIQIF